MKNLFGRSHFFNSSSSQIVTHVCHLVLGMLVGYQDKEKSNVFFGKILIKREILAIWFIYKLKGKVHFKKHYWGKLNWLKWYEKKFTKVETWRLSQQRILSNENLKKQYNLISTPKIIIKMHIVEGKKTYLKSISKSQM